MFDCLYTNKYLLHYSDQPVAAAADVAVAAAGLVWSSDFADVADTCLVAAEAVDAAAEDAVAVVAVVVVDVDAAVVVVDVVGVAAVADGVVVAAGFGGSGKREQVLSLIIGTLHWFCLPRVATPLSSPPAC